jgi:hypothetical protein
LGGLPDHEVEDAAHRRVPRLLDEIDVELQQPHGLEGFKGAPRTFFPPRLWNSRDILAFKGQSKGLLPFFLPI